MRILPDHYFQIKNTKIWTPKVKKDFKIVALGDLHLSKLVGKNKLEPIKYQLEKENGDYYAFLGDLIDAPEELNNKEKRQELYDLIKTSASLGPTMIILGSHDYVSEAEEKPTFSYDDEFWNKVNNLNNVYVLNCKTYKDDKAYFMGYMQPIEYYYDKYNPRLVDQAAFYRDFVNRPELYENVPQDIPSIGLIHSPEYANTACNADLLKNYDLLLAGHDHDGCIPLGLGNGTRGLISPKKDLFPQNVRGTRILDTGTILIINGGIVKIQNCAPQIIHWMNHLCPMQIDTVEFHQNADYCLESKKETVYSRTRKK